MAAIKVTRTDRVFNFINILLMLLVAAAAAYPIYFTILASLSDPYAVVSGRVTFWPIKPTLEAYTNAFKEGRIWQGYKNTMIYTGLGTALSLLLTIPAGYVLSKKELPGHGFITFYFLLTMYFSGGLIPSYLNIKWLGLINNAATLIILGGMSVYNVVVTRAFFASSVPNELYESAYIDGASEARSFFSIALPLAKAIIAVMALFYAVSRWNDYYTAMIYVSRSDLQPLQAVLRGILLMNQSALSEIDVTTMEESMVMELTRKSYMAEAMKYAMIFIASAPLLIAYPFVQKYFVKGVLIGSVKG